MKIKDKLFWEKVIKKPNDCWEYTGKLNPNGYGHVRRSLNKKGVKDYLAHRYSWYLKYEVFPVDNCLHACDNPKCVNTNHLFEGSHQDNADDKVRKGRWRGPDRVKEQDNGNSKLTNQDVSEIKKLIKEGETNISIAKMYLVHHSTISTIRVGKNWSDIK